MQPLMQLLMRYLKQTSLIKMFVHLVWLCCILIVCSITYIITFHFQSVWTAWQKSLSIQHFKSELMTTVSIDNTINQELQQLLLASQADRAYVFRYHNGIPSVASVPFIFHTMTHEAIRAGVSRVIFFHQRIPSSLNSASYAQFTKGSCVTYNNLDDNHNSAVYWHYESRQAKSMIRCPLFTSRGDIVGFVGIDWTSDKSNLSQQEPLVRNTSSQISKAFDNVKS